MPERWVLNASPLIVLARLGYEDWFLTCADWCTKNRPRREVYQLRFHLVQRALSGHGGFPQ
jgi:hypothetical protein